MSDPCLRCIVPTHWLYLPASPSATIKLLCPTGTHFVPQSKSSSHLCKFNEQLLYPGSACKPDSFLAATRNVFVSTNLIKFQCSVSFPAPGCVEGSQKASCGAFVGRGKLPSHKGSVMSAPYLVTVCLGFRPTLGMLCHRCRR